MTDEPSPDPVTTDGGDPACWLGLVCEQCGRIHDERPSPRPAGPGSHPTPPDQAT